MNGNNKNTKVDNTDIKSDISDGIKSGRAKTTSSCVKCGDGFETWIIIDTGDYDEIFCSNKCGTEYFCGTYNEPEYD